MKQIPIKVDFQVLPTSAAASQAAALIGCAAATDFSLKPGSFSQL
jgi:precorrin-3B methylase